MSIIIVRVGGGATPYSKPHNNSTPSAKKLHNAIPHGSYTTRTFEVVIELDVCKLWVIHNMLLLLELHPLLWLRVSLKSMIHSARHWNHELFQSRCTAQKRIGDSKCDDRYIWLIRLLSCTSTLRLLPNVRTVCYRLYYIVWCNNKILFFLSASKCFPVQSIIIIFIHHLMFH